MALIDRTRPGLSVVIPCYNEEAVLPELIRRLLPVCEANFPGDYEVVLINDGSRDATWPMITAYAKQYAPVVGLNLSRNYGHQVALTAGLELCRGELIFILDADLQDPPELLPAMIEKVTEGHDVVYGQRVSRAGETWFKKATAHGFYRTLSRLADVEIPRNTGDFRLITRRVLDALNAMPERYRFIRGLIGSLGFSQVALPYQREARFAGETHYPLRKMIAFAIDAITGFSTIPLRMASWFGLIFGVAGVAALGWVGISYFTHGTVQGWASLAALILIIGSTQSMMLGIFGEYLGRMYMETKRRPLYVIESIEGVAAAATVESPARTMQERLRNAVNG